jgi:putative heme iron utilization protein
MKVLKEHTDSMEEDIKSSILDGPSLGVQDIHYYSRLAGQYNAFKQILEPKEFLSGEFDEDKSEDNT